MSVTMDETDRKILTILQEDAALSAAEIAERVGLSQSPCWRRINRLEQAGIILGRVAKLDREALGLKVLVYVQVKLSSHGRQSLPAFEKAVKALPAIIGCHLVLGDMDMILEVVARDMKEYETFWREELSQLPEVQEIRSLPLLSHIKNRAPLPIYE